VGIAGIAVAGDSGGDRLGSDAVLVREFPGELVEPLLAPRRESAIGRSLTLSIIGEVEGSDPFGGMFGDPDELRARLAEMAEQMQGAQRVAWADNAIKLAVDMTVAAINRLDLSGSSDEQAVQVRDAIRIVFPESVTLVREAREGLS
jgi:hypothetical protein